MDRYVPLAKKSKKEQKKFHALQRNTWNGLNPVTRTVPNGKAYNRKKQKQRDFRDENTCCFLYKTQFAYFTDDQPLLIMTAKMNRAHREAQVPHVPHTRWRAVMRKNNYKVILKLTKEEARLAVSAMMEFRNRCLAQGKPTEDLDELILKLCKA